MLQLYGFENTMRQFIEASYLVHSLWQLNTFGTGFSGSLTVDTALVSQKGFAYRKSDPNPM